MPILIPGDYIIYHGALPLPAPAKPGQGISIPLGNPSDVKYTVWNFIEAEPLPAIGPIVKGYYIRTEDKSAYLALMDPAAGKGGLTTSTDPSHAVRFFLDHGLINYFPPTPTFWTISAAGGLVTLVPPPKGVVGTAGTVQLLPQAVPNQTGESQLWSIQYPPLKVSSLVSSIQQVPGTAPLVPNGRFLVANNECALVPGNPGSTLGLPLDPGFKEAWYLESAPADIAAAFPGKTCHVLRTGTGNFYLGTMESVVQASAVKEQSGIVLLPVTATTTTNEATAWAFTLEGEYQNDKFTGELVSPDGRYKFGVQPPQKQLFGSTGTPIMSPAPDLQQSTWTLTLSLQ